MNHGTVVCLAVMFIRNKKTVTIVLVLVLGKLKK